MMTNQILAYGVFYSQNSTDMNDFPSKHPTLGIDHGDSRIGISATDDFGILAHPVETIHTRTTEPINRICELVRQRNVKQIVMGLPIRLDGTEGDAAKKVRTFAGLVAAALPGIPLILIDESYTTQDATEKLREAGRKAHQQKKIIDQAAAVEILNRWMEEQS